MSRLKRFMRTILALSAASIASAPARAGAQEAVMNADGTCQFIVPNHSVCYKASGECYLGSTYLGNYLSDCNPSSPAAIASLGAAGVDGNGGATPDSCSIDNQACAKQSDCCATTYPLYCNPQTSVCCHAYDAGVGGDCSNGNNGCCHGGVGPKLDCNQFNKCIYDVGWAANVWANPATVSGTLNRFSEMDALWVVPAKPTIPNDVIQFVLWIGFQQNGQDIVQPELWYHSSSNTWQIFAQYHVTGGSYPSGPHINVSVGDDLTASTFISDEAPGYGDFWTVSIQDTTLPGETGLSSIVMADGTGPGNPGFNQALAGIIEVQGLAACDGLPSAGGQEFTITGIFQTGSGTNGWKQGNTVNVQYDLAYNSASKGFSTGQPDGPYCNYNGFISSFPFWASYISWNTSP